MTSIKISNIKIKNLTPMDFYNNRDYKMFGVGSGSSTLVPIYKELLKEILGAKVNEIFNDYTLNIEETIQIQTLFEREVEKELATRKITGKPPHKAIEFKGKVYDLDLRLTSPTDRIINDYFTIISICKECLKENKPMYLSIE